MVQKLKKEDGTSIVSRDEKLQDKIDNNIKYDIWEPHSSYTAGTRPTSKIKYRAWQLPLIGIDKILRLFNPKEYFDKEKYSGLDDAFSKGVPRKETFNGTVEDYKKQKK